MKKCKQLQTCHFYRVTGSSKDEDGIMTAQNVHLKSQSNGHPCKTPVESDSDSREPKTLVLEGRYACA